VKFSLIKKKTEKNKNEFGVFIMLLINKNLMLD